MGDGFTVRVLVGQSVWRLLVRRGTSFTLLDARGWGDVIGLLLVLGECRVAVAGVTE